jgi:sugar lactone lactonase YvrE
LATESAASVTLHYDFAVGAQNWSPLFTNYPVGSEVFYELESGLRPLPAELGVSGNGYMLSGNNHSDDLVMALKRSIGPADGLEPGRTYWLDFTIEFASDAQTGCFGAGGAPGEGVVLRVGATNVEPMAVADASNYYLSNPDFLGRSGATSATTVIGNVANGVPCGSEPRTYKRLINQHWHDYPVTAGSDGRLWLVVLTRSGFEATTRLYYLKISVTLTPAPTEVFFPDPTGIVADGSGNLFVSDSFRCTVQRVSSSNQVSLVAGTIGSAGSDDGTGSSARFNQPSGLTVAPDGTLSVTDTANATIRRISAGRVVTTLAGSSGKKGSVDGIGSEATFSAPEGIARTADDTLYVADTLNSAVRKISRSGAVSTFAGTPGKSGSTDGKSAQFSRPAGVAVDASGNVYVADTGNATIRKISPEGTTTTLAGLAGVAGIDDGIGDVALFNAPRGVAVSVTGDLFVADTGNSTIRRIAPTGAVNTFAGLPGVSGLRDGAGSGAQFDHPQSLTLDSAGNLYVADTGNASIRRITPDAVVTTLALSADPADPSPPPPTPSPQPPSPTPAPGPSASSGGDGGGGAVGSWLGMLLGLLAICRLIQRDTTGARYFRLNQKK